MSKEMESRMRVALAQAEAAARAGETPVGAAVFLRGECVAAAHNRCESDGDPTAHAETLAIRQALRALGGARLTECELYVTMEPCPMCAGAILLARVGMLRFGAWDARAGCMGSVYDFGADPALAGSCQTVGGVLEAECAGILTRFFRERRGLS